MGHHLWRISANPGGHAGTGLAGCPARAQLGGVDPPARPIVRLRQELLLQSRPRKGGLPVLNTCRGTTHRAPTIFMSEFSDRILAWYDKNARRLPWRVPPGAEGGHPDPYAV